jgi:hypothetical protein
MGADHRASHSRRHSMHRYQHWRKDGVELACVGDIFAQGRLQQWPVNSGCRLVRTARCPPFAKWLVSSNRDTHHASGSGGLGMVLEMACCHAVVPLERFTSDRLGTRPLVRICGPPVLRICVERYRGEPWIFRAAWIWLARGTMSVHGSKLENHSMMTRFLIR